MRSVKRIPSLDGLRAISILVVTASHLIALAPGNRSLKALVPWGPHGVDVFFVISGFLISSLLLKEMNSVGCISLKSFYLRRARRIIPAFAFYFLMIVTLRTLGVFSFGNGSLLCAATYTYNLVPHLPARPLGHVWSLCVEEHFYLVWPIIVLLVPRRRLALVLTSGIILAIPIRYFLTIAHKFLDPDFFTLTRWDTIACGCLLAVLWDGERRDDLHSFLAKPQLPAIALALYLVSAAILGRSGKYAILLQHPIESALLAVFVGAMIVQHRSVFGRILNSRLLVWIGLLSYSIYLGQFALVPMPISRFVLPLSLLGSYAVISYYVIEQPVLKSKKLVPALYQTASNPE
jgi:peptidoglycan/LPS O-acetylase OafA/YrhL